MQSISVDHLESVVKMLGSLRLRDTRNLFSILRQCDPQQVNMDDTALANAFLPHFGVCVGEVGFAYIVNAPSRTNTRRSQDRG